MAVARPPPPQSFIGGGGPGSGRAGADEIEMDRARPVGWLLWDGRASSDGARPRRGREARFDFGIASSPRRIVTDRNRSASGERAIGVTVTHVGPSRLAAWSCQSTCRLATASATPASEQRPSYRAVISQEYLFVGRACNLLPPVF